MNAAAGRSVSTYSFLELLDRTFRVYRENFLSFVGLTALVMVPITLINLLLSSSMLTTTSTRFNGSTSVWFGDPNAFCLAGGVSIVLALIQAVLINGPITFIASESQFGRKVSIGEAFRARQSRFTTLGCGFGLLYGILFAFLISVALLAAICAPVLISIGIVAYIGVATYAFLVPVLILENVSTSMGLNRAWSLGKARFWTAFGLIAVIGLLSFIISLAFTALVQFFFLQSISSFSTTTAEIVNALLALIISVFVTPLLPIALTLLYYDTRVRLEGLDIALQALDRPDARPYDLASPAPVMSLNSRDWVNITILVGGAIVLTLLGSALLMNLVNLMFPGLPVS